MVALTKKFDFINSLYKTHTQERERKKREKEEPRVYPLWKVLLYKDKQRQQQSKHNKTSIYNKTNTHRQQQDKQQR